MLQNPEKIKEFNSTTTALRKKESEIKKLENSKKRSETLIAFREKSKAAVVAIHDAIITAETAKVAEVETQLTAIQAEVVTLKDTKETLQTELATPVE